MTYQVKNWNEHFENAKSRTYDRCAYLCMPNKQHGMGFLSIVSEADGASIVGIWTMILQSLSQQKLPREGWLTDDGTETGRAWTIPDLAMRWRRTEDEIARALDVLCSEKVCWLSNLTESPILQSYHADIKRIVTIPVVSTRAREGKGKEGKGTEGKGRENNRAKNPRSFVFEDLPECPVWLNPETWRSWFDFRKDELKKPLSPKMVEAQFKKLDRWRQLGQSPEEIIENSIAGGWQGLFEIKPGNNGSGSSKIISDGQIAYERALKRDQEAEAKNEGS